MVVHEGLSVLDELTWFPSLQVYGKDQTLGLLTALKLELANIMLFLKSVERIEILQWDEDQPGPTFLSACSVANATANVRQARSLYEQASQVCPLLRSRQYPH